MATKDYHITSIPSLPVYKSNRTKSRFFYGFGFDSLNDDYKVVIFVRCKYGDDVYAETRIYSLRHNAWSKSRRTEVNQRKLFPLICSFNSSLDAPNGVVASSALHWLAGSYPHNNTLSSSFILAFDLASEQFREMQLPDHVREQQEIQIRVKRERFIEFTRVVVLGGYLCVSSRDCFENPFFDIWVLKDYKIHDSWTKFCRIMLHDKTVSSLIPVLAYNRNNLMLLEIYRSFHCYNIQKRRLNYLPNFYPGLYTTVICLGTLVSISAYRALWKKGNRARGRKRSRESRDDINVQSQFDAR
ncbi:hypothetical protein SLEP1_g42838 [Rubroshorea leprosula]|uniref:F-box associated beta-propeller type 1 domain-containing protein n=1 Tax=Rubroshorea leprosula TaxID=152421 RepID=A0AAV5LC48_9ROSI|nr:hypothetical protein SLEP1_g42838 [Rubroshorea leprosula]